jgi:hypothetical protein
MWAWMPALCHWYGLKPDDVENLTWQQFDVLTDWIEDKADKSGG